MPVQPFISRVMCLKGLMRNLSTRSPRPVPTTNLSCANVPHYSATSATRRLTNRGSPFMIALFGVGGGVALGGAVYCKRHPSFLHAIMPWLPDTLIKRCFCASSTTEADMPGWTDESKKLYQQYSAELLPQGWTQIRTTVGRERNQRSFAFNHPDIGSTFEYIMFCKEDEQRSVTIMQFGEKVQGPEGYVHGGAIATAGDICAGVLMYTGLHIPCLTASLTVNYKKPIPLGSTVIIETKLDKVERRKHYLTSTIKSVDGSILYDVVTTLFIRVSAPPPLPSARTS